MTSSDNNSSAGGLIKSTVIAAVLAFVVTVFFVLPAEYGVDPTGAGEKMGLLDLGDVDAAEETPGSSKTIRTIEGAYPGIPDEFDFYEPDVLGAPYATTHDGMFRSDTITVNLELGEEVEYKALMKQGNTIVYSWKVNDGDVYTDFHADPGEDAEGYPDRYFIRYRESETNQSSGSLVAPFDGNHGWYWLNIQENPVEITLEVRGYYESVTEVYRGSQ